MQEGKLLYKTRPVENGRRGRFHERCVEDWVRDRAGMNISVSDQVSTCAKFPHGDSDYFLGAFSNIRVMKSSTTVPREVRITARVHFLDMWEGKSCT